MNSSSPAAETPGGGLPLSTRVLRALVIGLAALAGVSLLTAMSVTCVDILLRWFHVGVKGAYDVVKIASALAIAGGLPYTAASKGHVAVDYFLLKLPKRAQAAIGLVVHGLGMGLFLLFAWQCWRYGLALKRSGEVSLTLQVPLFWIPLVMACACGVTAWVFLHDLIKPGQPLVKS